MTTKKKVLTAISVFILLLATVFLLPENKSIIKTRHFTFIFSNSIDHKKIIEISTGLENSYLRIARNLITQPDDHIEVNIYANKWNYIKATKHFGSSGSIEGPSKIHFIETSLQESVKIAVHEFTHTVVLNLLIDRESQPLNAKTFDKKISSFPAWLWEGVSVYEAHQFIDPKNIDDLRKGKYPSIRELNTRYKGQKSYTHGYTLIEFILNKYKSEKLIELIENYGDLKKTLGITEEQFSKEWYVFVREKYLK
jgi:hypothetical protein